MTANRRYFPIALAAICAAVNIAPQALAADYATTVTGLKPVAYYRLNETNAVPKDTAVNTGALGAEFNGEYQAMQSSHGQPGAIVGDADTAVGINGANGQQVVVPFSPKYNPSGPFSVEFWAKPTGGSTGSGNHVAAISMVNGQNASNADDRSGWCVRHSAADWQFVLGFDHSDGATYYHTTLAAPGTAVEDTWQHVVAVYTSSAVSLYVNGAEAATVAPAKPVMPNTAAPLILGDRGYTGWDFNGQLDEVALYTNALTAAEIKSHYDNGMNANRTKAYKDLVLEKTPALYYRLSEAAVQLPIAKNTGSWGTAADATYQAGCTTASAGPQNPAFNGFSTNNLASQLNGSSGHILIPVNPLNTDSISFAAWIKRNGSQSGWNAIVFQRNSASSTTATGFGIGDANDLRYHWNDQDYGWVPNPRMTIPDGVWTFVAASFSATESILCLNGVLATNTVAHEAHDFSAEPIFIGQDPIGGRFFNGSIDEVAIFDKALTAAEIKSLYNAALPAILSITRTPADPVYEGLTVTFQATVASQQSSTYQWRKDGQPLTGKTASSLVLAGVKVIDSGSYDVVVVSGGVNLTSPASSLEVKTSVPVLSQTPKSVVRFLNGAATFACQSLGSQPLTFQWKHGSNVLAGATNATLALTDLQPADAGDYTVVVTNPLGSTNVSATLTLLTPTKYASAITDANPIGYWRLDETNGSSAFDYWGTRDGSFGVGIATNIAGPQPAAFAGFEASNKAYDITAGAVSIPPINLNKATLTIVAWIKPNGAQPNYAGLVFSRGGSVSGLDFQQADNLGYHWNDAANTYNWQSGLIPTDAQWNFVALVVEPTQATMYLDDGSGIQSAVNTVTHGSSSFDGTILLGQDGGGGRQFKGSMDEVAIFDRSLSETEITAIRDAGIKGTYSAKPAAIAQQPKGQTIMEGSSYTLSARASGSVPLTYQWQKNGQDIAGAIRSSLAFPSATVAESGNYQLIVSQGSTKVTSATVALTVKPVPAYLSLPEDLVLHLKFDGDYKDASGRNNNGTPQGSPQIVAGKVGSGALRYSTTLSGSAVAEANYLSLGTPSDLNFGGSTSFSVAFWIKFSGSPGDLPFLCNNQDSYGGKGFVFAPSYETGSWSWSLNDGTTPQGWPGFAAQYGNDAGYANSINDDQWHHLVFLVDRNGDVTTYTDGVKVHAKSIAGLVFDLNTDLAINIGQGANADYAVAGSFEMDDLGVWRRVLTDYDAQALYIVGKNYGRSFDTTAPPSVSLTITRSGLDLELKWTTGTLESADAITGPWTTVAAATSPFKVTPQAGKKFYRLKL